MEFKKGDRVRLLKNYVITKVGWIGQVINVNKNELFVQWVNHHTIPLTVKAQDCVLISRLFLARNPKNRSNRKT